MLHTIYGGRTTDTNGEEILSFFSEASFVFQWLKE